jgi:hypothetical protein
VRTAELAHSLGRPGRAIIAANRALELEPWHEAAHRAHIAAHLGLGDLDGARRAVEQCFVALADLGVEPEAATAMLARRTGSSFAPG